MKNKVKIWVLRFGEDTRWFPSIKYISFRIFKLLTSFNEFQQPHSRIEVYPMVLTFDISGQRFPITKPPLHVNPSHHCRDQAFERSGVSFSIVNQVRLFKRSSRLQVVTWHRCACETHVGEAECACNRTEHVEAHMREYRNQLHDSWEQWNVTYRISRLAVFQPNERNPGEKKEEEGCQSVSALTPAYLRGYDLTKRFMNK